LFAEKLKYLQGYVRVRLTGYAPERFLNLCSNHNILIWNLEYHQEQYEFCISLKGFRQLKPILKKTRTRIIILERFGLPFCIHKYRKRKLFFLGIVACAFILYMMSLFIWNIDIQGNLHRTDGTIIKFLEENNVYHGIRKSKLDCVALEELLRSEFDDIIWTSVKIQGTRLIIDIQENLVSNKNAESKQSAEATSSSLVANKDTKIYSILTRNGTPLVEKGSVVAKGDMLVEGKIPIYNDNGEVDHYQYCEADADILGITTYTYSNELSMNYEDKVFSGEEKECYKLRFFKKWITFPFGKHDFAHYEKITTEIPLKLGESFYLPVVLYKEVSKEYVIEPKIYQKSEAEGILREKLMEFCEKLEQKGVQIIENNVIIVAEGKRCTAKGELIVIEPIGVREPTTTIEIQQEGQKINESDRNDN